MIYYKVVKKVKNKLYSAAVLNKKYKQQYKVKEWVEAKVGGFLVFNNLDDAKNFVRTETVYNSWFFIYECKARDEVPLGGFSDFVLEENPTKFDRKNMEVVPKEDDVMECWDSGFSGTGRYSHWFPMGSKAFKKINLVKKVAEKKGYDNIKDYGEI